MIGGLLVLEHPRGRSVLYPNHDSPAGRAARPTGGSNGGGAVQVGRRQDGVCEDRSAGGGGDLRCEEE